MLDMIKKFRPILTSMGIFKLLELKYGNKFLVSHPKWKHRARRGNGLLASSQKSALAFLYQVTAHTPWGILFVKETTI